MIVNPKVRKVLFLSSIPTYPNAFGGGELSLHFFLQVLLKNKWGVECISGLEPDVSRKFYGKIKKLWYRFGGLVLKIPAFKADYQAGYKTWRGDYRSPAGHEFIFKQLREIRPEAVVGYYYSKRYDIENLKQAAALGIPVFCFVRVLSAILQDNRKLPWNINFIANSYFTAHSIKIFTNHEVPVITPPIKKECYFSNLRQPEYILFINPIPQKGVSILIEAAKKIPEEKFLVIKGGWSFCDYTHKNIYIQQLSELQNVTLLDERFDMKEIYKVAKILFFPSQSLETFGRAIIEAHINSIPVVASDIGAVAETLGKGGLLIKNYSCSDEHIQALKELCSNKNLYKELSRLAYENSMREEFDFKVVSHKFISMLENTHKKNS
ncbi:MAG: glycosyltransferase family 4 protein [Candidatus Omnitrophota bacterium]|jgi:glycosyltransferase involved in cell wall biosynthesis